MLDASTARAVSFDEEPTVDTAPLVIPLHHVGDLAVQVQLESSVWCRKAVGGLETACGEEIHYGRLLGMRHESYLGELCTKGCFSRHELVVLAPRAQRLERDRADAHDGHHRQEFDTGRFIASRRDDKTKK